jgi:hypothetical protein
MRHTLTPLRNISLTLAFLAVVSASSGRPGAQSLSTSSSQFDAASVKVNRTRGRTTRRIEQDRLMYLNIALREFIQVAYGIRHYRIDTPSWIIDYLSVGRYDVIASAAMPSASAEDCWRRERRFHAGSELSTGWPMTVSSSLLVARWLWQPRSSVIPACPARSAR